MSFAWKFTVNRVRQPFQFHDIICLLVAVCVLTVINSGILGIMLSLVIFLYCLYLHGIAYVQTCR